jgi:hypothetical protein
MNMPGALFFALGGFFFWIFSFIYLRTYLKRRRKPFEEQILGDIRNEVDKLLSRIDETTARDIHLVEEQKKSLKVILDEAEKRMKVYARELDRQWAGEKVFAALSGETQGEGFAPGETYTELGRKFVRRVNEGEMVSPVETEALLASPPPGKSAPKENSPRFVRAAQEMPPKPVPPRERIQELARAGFSSKVIASRLGISITEVDMALALMEPKADL